MICPLAKTPHITLGRDWTCQGLTRLPAGNAQYRLLERNNRISGHTQDGDCSTVRPVVVANPSLTVVSILVLLEVCYESRVVVLGMLARAARVMLLRPPSWQGGRTNKR
jgi:hypothetical protein